MNGENSASASKTLVPTSKIDCFDVKLSQCGSTHDARLHRNVDVNLLEYGWGMFLQDLRDSLEFRVPCSLPTLATTTVLWNPSVTDVHRLVGVIDAASNDFAIEHEDAAHRGFINRQRVFSLSII